MPSNLVLMDDNFLVGIEFPGTTKQSMIKYVTSFCHSHTSAVFLPLIYATNLIQLHACISFDEKKSYLTFLEVTYQKHSLQGNVGFPFYDLFIIMLLEIYPYNYNPILNTEIQIRHSKKYIFIFRRGRIRSNPSQIYSHVQSIIKFLFCFFFLV